MNLEDKLQNPEPEHQQVEEAIEILRRLHEIRRVAVKRVKPEPGSPGAAESRGGPEGKAAKPVLGR